MTDQKTYTCRCGKKHEMLRHEGQTKKCGCGRVATRVQSPWGARITVADKVKK